MPHYVNCLYCKTRFDRDKIPFKAVTSRRYAHLECYQEESQKQMELEKDKVNLETYIMKLFGDDYVSPFIRKQINTYIQEYNYTYSGILKALIYFFEVKGNGIEKANNGIGIVPYVYKDAYNYYYAIWLANQKNENYVKTVETMEMPVREIRIPVPQRKIKERKLFTFLDEEVAENGNS